MRTLGEVKKLEKRYKNITKLLRTLRKHHIILYTIYDKLIDKVYRSWENIYN